MAAYSAMTLIDTVLSRVTRSTTCCTGCCPALSRVKMFASLRAAMLNSPAAVVSWVPRLSVVNAPGPCPPAEPLW
jgi:hypothetical protein